MNRILHQTTEGSGKCTSLLAALLSVSVLLCACGGGQGGVSIGSGQDADPVVLDFPIAYIKAPVPFDDNGDFVQNDLREQITFDFGADLYFRDRAAPSADAINITGEMTQGLAAIRDVEIAYDGSSIIFSMRFPFDPDLDEIDLPTWNIWKYTFATDTLERVIASINTAEIGHDIMPKYLPGGRIIFSSTRQTQSQEPRDQDLPGSAHRSQSRARGSRSRAARRLRPSRAERPARGDQLSLARRPHHQEVHGRAGHWLHLSAGDPRLPVRTQAPRSSPDREARPAE